MIDGEADGARFAEGRVAVTHDRDLAEGVNGIDLRRVRDRGHESVRHAFFETGDADNANIIALRCADDLKLRHGSAPERSMSDTKTTREVGGIDSTIDFLTSLLYGRGSPPDLAEIGAVRRRSAN